MKKITLFTVLFYFFLNPSLAQRTILFSGIEWDVSNYTGNPGPNNFSDSSDNVWVDSNGYLHLKIRKSGDIWYTSMIFSNKSFGYGEYRFYIASNVESYDSNVVVGLYARENDSKEIDIEFSRWGNANSDVGNYVMHPSLGNTNNFKIFPLNLSGNFSTHKFIWSQSNVYFQSYHGHYSTIPSPSQDYLIQDWLYTGNNNFLSGNEKLTINLWLNNGTPPANQQDVELIIKSVFVPSGSLGVLITPNEAITAGAQWNVDNGVWQSSGNSVSDLPAGSHTLSYKTITGWTKPTDEVVTINTSQTMSRTGIYVQQQLGSLQVTLSPSTGFWTIDGGTTWQVSGATVGNLPVGNYNLEFATVTGWISPAIQIVSIIANQTLSVQGNYELDDDRDGIGNSTDVCPNTPNGETVDSTGCSSSQLLGIDEDVLSKSVKLYPNPVTNILSIDSDLQLNKVEIYSELGIKMSEITPKSNKIKLRNLSKGIYFIKIYSKNGSTIKKLIIK